MTGTDRRVMEQSVLKVLQPSLSMDKNIGMHDQESGRAYFRYGLVQAAVVGYGRIVRMGTSIIERESPGTSGRRGSGGKRGWFTPVGSDIDSYVAGGP